MGSHRSHKGTGLNGRRLAQVPAAAQGRGNGRGLVAASTGAAARAGGAWPLACSFGLHLVRFSMFKTLVFLVGLALAVPAAFAQTTPAPVAKAPQYEHCILVLSARFFEDKGVRLEFGQNVKDAPQNPALVQANAVVRKLASVTAALDYMSSQGWECINVTTLSSDFPTPDTGYLLRRAK